MTNNDEQCQRVYSKGLTTAQETYQLEGYKDLSKWNDRDVQSVIIFDRIFVPAAIGACILTLTRAPEYYNSVFLGSVVVLIYWLYQSLAYRERISHRFNAMRKIECRLGFRAHRGIEH